MICQKFWQKTADLAQTKRAAKKRCTFYPRSNYIFYKDQLGYLIIVIERWLTHSFKSFSTTGAMNRKEQSQKWVSFKECMLCIIKSYKYCWLSLLGHNCTERVRVTAYVENDHSAFTALSGSRFWSRHVLLSGPKLRNRNCTDTFSAAVTRPKEQTSGLQTANNTIVKGFQPHAPGKCFISSILSKF